jgi:glycosyltransferase involved in cell wall biosynthesis
LDKDVLMSRAIVVVPCFNEAQRLNLRAIQEYGRTAEGAELLFVNDGSRDETLQLIEHLHRNNPRRFSFLHLAKNGGKAEAVRQGTLLALQSAPDYVGFWDADLATPLTDIASFARVLDARPRIELVIGTRMRLLGHQIDRRPARYWLGRAFANTASLALGLRVFDTQCGAKLFRATSDLGRLFERPFVTNWIFDVEILARIEHARRGTQLPQLREIVYELPLDRWCDVAGSTVKSRDFIKATRELARIYWTYLRPGAQAPGPDSPLGDVVAGAAPADDGRADQQQAA